MLRIVAAVAVVAGFAGAAQAQAPVAGLMLTCEGSDVEVRESAQTTVITMPPGTGSAEQQAAAAAARARAMSSYVGVRVPARMSVIVEGEKVRVRPSENNRPGLGRKASVDGWYDLSEVEVTETQIKGRAGFGGLLIGRHRLAIDRQTGDAKFGDFQGVCEKAATGPTERKF